LVQPYSLGNDFDVIKNFRSKKVLMKIFGSNVFPIK
jgi:hypothetical protein